MLFLFLFFSFSRIKYYKPRIYRKKHLNKNIIKYEKNSFLFPYYLSTYNKNHHHRSEFRNNPGEPIFEQTQPDGPGVWYRYLGAEYDYSEKLPSRNILSDFYERNTIKSWWIGHATNLLQVGNKFILTDPLFEDRASPIPFILTRKTKPACKISELPPISYVLISHDHWDHLSETTLREIEYHFPHVIFFAPIGVSKLIESWVSNVVEFDWRTSIIIDGIEITCFPARHAGNRFPFDFNTRLWCSWLIQKDSVSIYYAGDTGAGPHFKEVREFVKKPIDLVLIPIGPQEPTEVYRAVHLNPIDAANMVVDLDAKTVVPVHWGIFALGLKPEVPDLELLKRNWKKGDLNILKVGGYVQWNGKKFIPGINSLLESV